MEAKKEERWRKETLSLKAACSNIITVLSSYHLNNNIMIMCVKECGLGNFIWWAILSVTRSFFSRLNPSRQKTDIVRSKNAKNCASYVHCLQVAIITQKGGSWGYLYKRSLFTDNPPSPWKVGHTRVYVPCFFRTVGRVLLRPSRTR